MQASSVNYVPVSGEYAVPQSHRDVHELAEQFVADVLEAVARELAR